jgi:RNA polymerase sigma factor (sigma-70 family)
MDALPAALLRPGLLHYTVSPAFLYLSGIFQDVGPLLKPFVFGFLNSKNGGLEMEKEKKPYRYFSKLIHNSNINEFRQNDNAEKYISPVGDDLYDIDSDIDDERGENEDLLELFIGNRTPLNWLMFIENPQLHRALSQLTADELELLFLAYVSDHNQKELASLYGLSQQGISYRFKKICEKIKKVF